MFKINLDATKVPACSIWIDLMKFPMPHTTDMILSDLGLSEEQLSFARDNVVSSSNSRYTTLFYRYCSMRIINYIPKTFAKVISGGYDYIAMTLDVENLFDLPVLPKLDVYTYRTLLPDAVVVSFSQELHLGERIVVHRNLNNDQRMVQYCTRGDRAYPLFNRLMLLKQHSDAILITNDTIREVLRIGT
jgi:hypothetical protein